MSTQFSILKNSGIIQMKAKLKNNHKKIKTILFTQFEDKNFGKRGTYKRKLYDAKLNEEINYILIYQSKIKF